MSDEEKVELLEISENLIDQLLRIERESFLINQTQLDNLFRGLHNLKGTLSMLQTPEIILELLHRNEDLLKECYKVVYMEKEIFNTLYSSVNQISDYLLTGKLTESFDKIHICGRCKTNPKEYMPEGCKHDFTQLSSQLEIKPEEALPLKYRSNAKTLLIANTTINCQITNQLLDFKCKHDKINCIKDLHRLGKEILKYEVIIIDADYSTAPVFLSLKVLNTIHKKALILICGTDRDMTFAHDFSDVNYYWLGKNSSRFNDIFERTLLKLNG